MSGDTQPPRTFNHVGLIVPDIEAAVTFYTTILHFRQLSPTPRHVLRSEDKHNMLQRIYGSAGASINEMKIALLTSDNSIGLELFEFVDPPIKHGAEFDITRGGFFHICITDSDPKALAERVVKAGGSALGEVCFVDGVGDQAVYLQDPWGNTIEVLSCAFEELFKRQGGDD